MKTTPEGREKLREVLSAGVISWTDRLGEPLASTIFSVLDDLEAAEARVKELELINGDIAIALVELKTTPDIDRE